MVPEIHSTEPQGVPEILKLLQKLDPSASRSSVQKQKKYPRFFKLFQKLNIRGSSDSFKLLPKLDRNGPRDI